MHAIDYVIYVSWSVFWLVWLVAAVSAKRAARTRMGRFMGARIAVVVVLVLLSRSAHLVVGRTDVGSPILQVIGTVLFGLGLALALWARVYLGRNWGTPMSEKVDAELVTNGPYRYVRNPIYTGIILAALGTAVAVSWTWLIVVVFLVAYFVYSAVAEERIMERLFPDEYPAYKESTKMLIPFVF